MLDTFKADLHEISGKTIVDGFRSAPTSSLSGGGWLFLSAGVISRVDALDLANAIIAHFESEDSRGA